MDKIAEERCIVSAAVGATKLAQAIGMLDAVVAERDAMMTELAEHRYLRECEKVAEELVESGASNQSVLDLRNDLFTRRADLSKIASFQEVQQTLRSGGSFASVADDYNSPYQPVSGTEALVHRLRTVTPTPN